jgi:putative membrane protein
MKSSILAAALLATAVTFSSSAAFAQNKNADKESVKFIKAAIQGNLAEIDAGKLAQEKGKSDSVKQYGAMLVKDHGAANTKAEAAAKELGVDPPKRTSAMHTAEYLKLKVLSGDTFDRSFAKGMVKDHEADVKEYQKASMHNDAAGKYAKETLPTLQEHLKAAQTMNQQVQLKQSMR